MRHVNMNQDIQLLGWDIKNRAGKPTNEHEGNFARIVKLEKMNVFLTNIWNFGINILLLQHERRY